MSFISVVIPVHNSVNHLRSCLQHLRQSGIRKYQCIVVDDGSTDNSAEVARSYGATVIKTGARRGPAHARNLGARAATGDILFFIDADVCVYPGTLSRILEDFEQDPELDALIGSYDDSPKCEDFLSQYRNLMHCYIHQKGRKEAVTFWSGCGAIRKSVFLEHSGFDESYRRPAIEDIELGYRMVAAGRKLMLDRDLVVKHLKKWSFWNLVKTDILDRGIPWTELILRDNRMPNDLNVQLSQRISVALVFILLALGALIALRWHAYFLAPLFAIVFFLLARYWVEPGSHSRSKGATVAMTGSIAAIVALSWWSNMITIIPPLLLGFVLMFLRHRYYYTTYRKRKVTGALVGLYMAFTLLFILTYLPNNLLVFSFVFVLLVVVALNVGFYMFLAAKRGRLFAITAIPFHLLYHFYNGLSFMAGFTRHMLRRTPPSIKAAGSGD